MFYSSHLGDTASPLLFHCSDNAIKRVLSQAILLKYTVKQIHVKEIALKTQKILTSLRSKQSCYWASRTFNKIFFYATHRRHLHVELCASQHQFCQGVPKRHCLLHWPEKGCILGDTQKPGGYGPTLHDTTWAGKMDLTTCKGPFWDSKVQW